MNNGCGAERYETTGRDKNLTAREIYMHVLLAVKAVSALTSVNILMNPLYPALERLPFSGFQSSLIADRRGSAIWPATQNPVKRQTAPAAEARMATVHWQGIFL